MYPRLCVQPPRGPENLCQPCEYESVDLMEVIDGEGRGKDCGEETCCVGIFAGRGQQALENPMDGFAEQGMLIGQSRVGEKRDRIELSKHPQPRLLKAQAELRMLFEESDPSYKGGVETAVGSSVPDGGEEPGNAAGLGGEGLCGAKSFGQVEQFGGSPRDFVRLALRRGQSLRSLSRAGAGVAMISRRP